MPRSRGLQRDSKAPNRDYPNQSWTSPDSSNHSSKTTSHIVYLSQCNTRSNTPSPIHFILQSTRVPAGDLLWAEAVWMTFSHHLFHHPRHQHCGALSLAQANNLISSLYNISECWGGAHFSSLLKNTKKSG